MLGTSLIDRLRSGGLPVLILACVAAPAGAQTDPFAPRARSEFEVAAFREIQDERDPTSRLDLTEAFLIRYPESELRHLALRARWQALVSLGDFAAVLGIAETALAEEIGFFEERLASIGDVETLPGFAAVRLRHYQLRVSYYESLTEAHNRLGNSREAVRSGERGLAAAAEVAEFLRALPDPGAAEYEDARARHRAVEGFLLRNLAAAHRSLGNTSGVVTYGRRALEITPNDLFTLITIATAVAERPPVDDGTRTEVLAEAGEYAIRALDELERLAGGPLAEGISPDDLARFRFEAHGSLGLLYFHQGRLADAQEQYREALGVGAADPVTYYRLGIALANDRQPEAAIRPLASAVFLGFRGAEARDALIRVYESVHGDLDGMEELIDSVGAGLPAN